jgi:His/Glu/Gln/Arg/opine family amino acid ABC transporter permease subunit
MTGKYPPFSFYSQTGDLVGFDVDVAEGVAEHLDRELVIVTTEWDGILAGLLLGKFDGIIGSMAITPERAEKVSFSIPYYVSGAQLFVHERDSAEIRDIYDTYGRKIGVGLGETFEHYLRNHHRSVQVVTYKSSTDIFQDMHNRRLDGFVTDRLVGLYQIRQSGRPFVPSGPLLYVERMAIPVTQDRPKLLNGINEALQEMKRSGELDRIHEKWFGFTGPSDTDETSMKTGVIVEKLAKGFGITLLVAFLSIAIGFILAIPLGVVLNNPKFPLHIVFRSLNDFIRGTPVLIQLFFVYFGTPQIGIALTPIQAAVITLTINTSAYMSEVIRSGLMSVDYGQLLAGRALGLNRYQIFAHVIWPQAFRIALPPLMNSVVALIKDTALIAIISVAEVVREAQSIISVTYDPMKYYFIVGLMFFIVTFPLMKLSGRLERRIRQKGFVHD